MEGLKNITVISPAPKFASKSRIELKTLNLAATVESVQDLNNRITAVRLRFHITQKN